MSEVINLAYVKDDNRLITPEQMLVDVLAEARTPGFPKKMIVIALDDEEGAFITPFWCSNIRSSEIVALCRVVSAKVEANIMGLKPL